MTTNLPKSTNNLPEINAGMIHMLKGNHQPVLVVGMHNSGTSILTEILHKNGIFFGNNMHHYESHFFSIFINDRVILGGGDNWAKIPLMNMDDVLSFESSAGAFIKTHWIADYLQWGYDGKSRWGIKDPRLCILLPLYLKIFPEATVIHIKRNPDDVAASLTRRYKAGVGVLNDFDHWKSLTGAYTNRVISIKDQCASFYEIHYEDLCTQPQDQTKRLFNFLSIPFTPATEELLAKVTQERIGSYDRLQVAKKHPLRSKLKSLLGK